MSGRPRFTTKDSGERIEFASGMRRDTQDDKPDLYLWIAHDIPYEYQLLTRAGRLARRGADKYGERNSECANSVAELERFKSSAFRHFMQWISGEEDEDHSAAVFFNLMQADNVKYRMENKKSSIEATAMTQ